MVTLTVLCLCLMLILLSLVMLVDVGCSVMFSCSLCKKMVLIPDVQRLSGLDERGSPPLKRTLSPGGAGPGAAQTSICGAGCKSTAPSHCRLHRCRLVDPLGAAMVADVYIIFNLRQSFSSRSRTCFKRIPKVLVRIRKSDSHAE